MNSEECSNVNNDSKDSTAKESSSNAVNDPIENKPVVFEESNSIKSKEKKEEEIKNDGHLIPEISITPSSPVITKSDVRIKKIYGKRRKANLGTKLCVNESKSVATDLSKMDMMSDSHGMNKTLKIKKSRFALALQKKFNSLSLGRNQRREGDVIRNENISMNKPANLKKVINCEIKLETVTDILISSFQLGLAYAVGKITSKPERDVLLNDFALTEEIYFPRNGSSLTPSHKLNDFSMLDYSSVAFKYFRDIFEISPLDFMTSLGGNPLIQISNSGASGSIFFLSDDDQFIVKSVDKRETEFLQQLLPGYYMNIHQNPNTYLPKFFGLYAFKTLGKTLRVVVMNNLLPSKLVFHEKYDLKGSTYKRRASNKERMKTLPTLKDLDFVLCHPMGIALSSENRNNLLKVLERDVRVLQSFKIMDYSLLLSVHNVTQYQISSFGQASNKESDRKSGMRLEVDSELYQSYIEKGIRAKNCRGEELILFIGLIDILQNYRLAKKTEHRFKSLLHDGNSVSVHNPKFYAERFINFVKYVFQDESIEAKPYPQLNSLNSFTISLLDDNIVANKADQASVKTSSMNEPQVIQEESIKVRSETSNENSTIGQTTESKKAPVEKDQI